MDPGHGAVGIADLPPLAGFGDHLNGQAGGAIFPQDAIVEARPLARTCEDFSEIQRGTSSPVGVGRPSGMVAPADSRTPVVRTAARAATRGALLNLTAALLDTEYRPVPNGRRPWKTQVPYVRSQA